MTPSEAGAGLVIVGTGIQFGRDLSRRTISEIESAEVVFGMSDEFAMSWMEDLRPDMRSLLDLYGTDKDRRDTYREMDAAVMAELEAGRRVCLVLYGHPGVFADVPHVLMRKARELGIPARMEPGISAEACLYADLGIDPGAAGTISLEATQYLVYRRRIDPTALLILWQVALAGDLSCTQFSAAPERLEVLVEKLTRDYEPETEVILYEAAQLPIQRFRADRLKLKDLPAAEYKEYTTLVIPPARALEEDAEFLARLRG